MYTTMWPRPTARGIGAAVDIDPLCQQPTTIGCPTIGTKCSPIFSRSEIGDYCRQKYGLLSDGDRDTVIENYCLRNDTEECKCANRSNNPDYTKLKQGNPYSDACWYIPCANRSRYFVPSDFNKQIQCPQNICQIVYDISKIHDVDINKVKNDINCDFTGGGIIPTPGGSGSLPNAVYYGSVLLAVLFILVYATK